MAEPEKRVATKEPIPAPSEDENGFLSTPVLGAGFNVDAMLRGIELESPDDSAPARLPRIDGYTLVDTVIQSRTGSVYRATEAGAAHRAVAIKLLSSTAISERTLRRLHREIHSLALLEHPSIARLLRDGATDDGLPFCVIEWIDGMPLRIAAESHAFTQRDRVRVIQEVAEALAHAHAKGILHRDLSPSNVIVRPADAPRRACLIDFGLARIAGEVLESANDVDDHRTREGSPMGTRGYMSPEQLEGSWARVDTRSEVFALGTMLYELLVGRLPWEVRTESFTLALAVMRSVAPPDLSRAAANVDADLRAVVNKCLALDQRERYQSMAELASDLGRWLAGEPVSARNSSAAERLVNLARRRPWAALSAAAVTTVLIVAIASVAVSRQRLLEETTAQRELITATIDDVLDEVWVLIGSESVREKLIGRLLARTDGLLRNAPDDSDLLLIRARLLRALGYLHADRSNSDEMLSVAREGLAVHDQLAPERSADVNFIRSHAEAVIRVGDALAESNVASSGTWNQRLDEVAAQYDRAEQMQLDALERHPGHLGLRDDLCWSCIRLLGYTDARRREESIDECIQLAEALLADSPGRDLSKLALCTAHNHAAMGIRGGATRATGDRNVEMREHLTEALELSRELVRSQPHRGAFVSEHLSILANLVAIDARGPEDLAARLVRAEEMERFIRGLDFAQLSRVDLQCNAVLGMCTLAHRHLESGRNLQASRIRRWLLDIVAERSVTWTPRGRALVGQELAYLEASLLPDAGDADPRVEATVGGGVDPTPHSK